MSSAAILSWLYQGYYTIPVREGFNKNIIKDVQEVPLLQNIVYQWHQEEEQTNRDE